MTSTLFHGDVSFGELLRAKRVQRDLTQAELAQRLGVQQQAVGRWELDKDLPRQETIRLISQQLDITGSQLAVALGYVDEEAESDDPAEAIRLPAGVKLSDKQLRALDAILDAFLDQVMPPPG